MTSSLILLPLVSVLEYLCPYMTTVLVRGGAWNDQQPPTVDSEFCLWLLLDTETQQQVAARWWLTVNTTCHRHHGKTVCILDKINTIIAPEQVLRLVSILNVTTTDILPLPASVPMIPEF